MAASTPALGPSVQRTESMPAASVVVLSGEIVPLPVTVHAITAPPTGWLAPSRACTTSGLASAAPTSPVWSDPETTTRCVGTPVSGLAAS